MKFLALYLPQYHSIEENDSWWGKDYTEWTSVKAAKPLFYGHRQPKIPLNNYYYNLSDESGGIWKWQASLANKYGIYGFCIYHYWFLGKKLLEKPIEILYNHPEIQIKYCFCWANESWTRTWYGKKNEILIKQEYGDSIQWEEHFLYLLKYFNDIRYIKVGNKPVMNIYRCGDIKNLENMLELWNKLAINNGYDGIYIVSSLNSINNIKYYTKQINAYYRFEPGYSTKNNLSTLEYFRYNEKILKNKIYNRLFNTNVLERKINIDEIYKRIIKISKCNKNNNEKIYNGVFPMWDNTPRRGYLGTVYTGATPQKFYNLLKEISKYTDNDDFIYINAWNEWGEGCYLEPDVETKYKYLEAINKIQIIRD